MGREILFRAKRTDNGKWVEGHYVYFKRMKNACMYYTYSDAPMVVNVKPETVCQYTGLSDENDKKIFEGDIVLINREDEYFVVKWRNDTAMFELEGEGFNADFEGYWEYEMEVIGNIFDNPEILKGEEEE